MEVSLSACLVALGYTLPLLMVSPVGSTCLAPQVPNSATGNSMHGRYFCCCLPSKGLGLKLGSLRNKLTG